MRHSLQEVESGNYFRDARPETPNLRASQSKLLTTNNGLIDKSK